MNSKIQSIQQFLVKDKADALLIVNSANISYLTDYISRDAFLIITKKNVFYITDSRYIQEIKDKLKFVEPFLIKESLVNSISEIVKSKKIKKFLFDGRGFLYSFYEKLKVSLGNNVNLALLKSNIIDSLRQIKSKEEVLKIKKATQITVDTFKYLNSIIKPGITELQIVGEIEKFIRYHGATDTSFDVIVASGRNSCYPHHLSSHKKVKSNEIVLVDMGVDYLGYKSDLTRVFFSGKINTLARKIYEIVLSAQKKAIESIKADVEVGKVDFAARDFIDKQGYGKFFLHSLGHGIGLEVHEAPTLSKSMQVKLEPGMVFTVEPAIYLPGKFGIRIEDLVLVTQKGCEVISGSLDK